MTCFRNTVCSALAALLLIAPAFAGVGDVETSAGEDDGAPAAAPAPAPTAPAPTAPTTATNPTSTTTTAPTVAVTPAMPVAPMAVPVASVAASAAGGDGRCAGDQQASRRPVAKPPAGNESAARAVGEAEIVAAMAAEGRALLRTEAKPADAVSYCSSAAELADRGEYRAAVQAAAMALFLGRQVGDKALVAHAARNLAYAYSLAGALDQAERWAQEAIAAAGGAKTPGIDQATVAPALKIRGDVALRRGQAAEAAALYNQAVAKLGKAEARPWYLVAQAEAARAQGQAQRAATLLATARREAPPALLPAIARAEAELALQQRDAARAVALFQQAAEAASDDPYTRMWALHGLGRAKRVGGDAKGALAALIDAVASAESVRARFRSEEFKAGFFGTAQDIFDDAIGAAFDARDFALALDLSERSRSRALLDLLIGRVQPQDGGLTFVDRVAPGASLAELRQGLPQGVAVVVYHVLKERTVAWVLRPGELRALAIGRAREALSAEVSRLLADMRESTIDVRQRLRDLHAALVAPLGLKPGEAMLAVAHDSLYMLPLGALQDGRAALIEERAVAILPSLNAMRTMMQSGPAANAGALVMGNPNLRDAKYDLPAAEREATAIAQQIPGSALYTRDAATRERLMAEAPGRRLVHVAAHALVDEIDPLASPLYLAGDGTAAAMTARDFYRVDLRAARLVTLSACETGLGKVGRGNEFWGFQRTMLAAGARGLLVSLWPVEDEATAALMTGFYAAAATQPLAAALREAQLALLRRYRDQPVLWAGFVLVGDWR